MAQSTIRPGSLVLYKNGAARVLSAGKKKIEIKRDTGETLSVRHKDVELLHPGPVQSLTELHPPSGEVQVAWELLAGSTTTLPELAELAYEAYTPATAWASWQLLDDGLYFRGSPHAVVANTAAEVAEERAAREAKAAQERAWTAFVERVSRGQYDPEQDNDFLREVEELAYGRFDQSRVMRELGRSETPENAHALLLELGYWDHAVNPYPVRLGLPTSAPAHELPPLPDEPRLDLTHLPAFAIDDAGSQDPDDAVSIDDGPRGVRLWVHVADVAALAPPDSAADLEARARGASLYLPEGTVPMLPPDATGRLALGLDEVSPALSLRIDLTAEGNIDEVDVARSQVRVQRLSYRDAERCLDEEDHPLHRLHALANRLQERRDEAGATSIDLPEVKVRVKEGRVVIRPLPSLRSRDLVREAMLIAGEAAARFAVDHDIPIPFTIQDPPDPLDQQLEGPAGQFALRRCFKRSQAATSPGAHAGLGLSLYAQTTSPLRRYLDLVVHQQLRAFLRQEPLLDETAILERVGAAEAVRGEVRYAERLSNEHWTLVYLLQNPDWQGEAVVVEQYGQRSKLLVPDLAYEVQMYLRRQPALNERVLLGAGEVNLAERQAHFRELSSAAET
ncbi:MAG: ribonuclease catalytic domain-containing protein [Chloroflexota bacterium]